MQTEPRLCIEGENLVPTSSRPACPSLEPRPGGLPVLGKSQHVGTSPLLTECGLGTDCSVFCFLHSTVILEM